ncbi:MAG: metalloregulator ArsR/SmtB family transcription factor [Burkholderiaceae bacterium]|jgi:DNA-binding transcriptional ArsR family regulator
MTGSDVDRTLAALADPTRRAVIDLLREKPTRAGELAETMNMSAPALSRHLRILRSNGLISSDAGESDARVRLYRLEPSAFVALRDWVGEVEALWHHQLAGFKARADKTESTKHGA